jgi:aspartate beta-hydroxylase
VWTSFDGTNNRIAYQESTLTDIVHHLETHSEEIRNDYLQHATVVQSDYDASSGKSEHSGALHTGSWDWHSYLLKGRVQPTFKDHFGRTAQILDALKDHLLTDIPFGFGFFSKLAAQSSIAAHSSPINFRLRLHLPLVVPSSKEDVGIQIASTKYHWTEGRVLVLDDSYYHAVWNNTSYERVLLLLDVWHPDVRPNERVEIVQMFQHAQEQGWWSCSSGNAGKE